MHVDMTGLKIGKLNSKYTEINLPDILVTAGEIII